MPTIDEYGFFAREQALYKAVFDLIEAETEADYLLSDGYFSPRTRISFDSDGKQITISAALDVETKLVNGKATLSLKDRGIDGAVSSPPYP